MALRHGRLVSLLGEMKAARPLIDLDPEVPFHYFYLILLAKESHKASPDSRG